MRPMSRRELIGIPALVAVIGVAAVLFLGTQSGPVADLTAALGLLDCSPGAARIVYETGPCASSTPAP